MRVVHASTAAVYAPSHDPVGEGARLAPTDVYGSTKLAAEGLLREHAGDGRRAVDLRVLRLFNVYGPGDSNPHLLPEILVQVRASDEITLGNLESRRDSRLPRVISSDARTCTRISGSRCGLESPGP